MRTRTDAHILVALAILAVAATTWAVKIAGFIDTEIFIDRAHDIVIVDVTAKLSRR